MWVVLQAMHLMYSSGGSCAVGWSWTSFDVGVEVPSGFATCGWGTWARRKVGRAVNHDCKSLSVEASVLLLVPWLGVSMRVGSGGPSGSRSMTSRGAGSRPTIARIFEYGVEAVAFDFGAFSFDVREAFAFAFLEVEAVLDAAAS